MAKPFGKRPNDWSALPSTKAFLQELACVRGIPRTENTTTRFSGSGNEPATVRNLHSDTLIKTINGGSNPGTWMHEDVALEFARWLSPAFAIWCNDQKK
ncbi:KilA-N domain-containing protein [Siphonobacter sp. SORGH_AS_1065]|uniref:KilA-N domain-containing protein n=1 Tax=Siphonobacter sp. SORGH_AS_1065 TaxID=3041795 RepID=UPI0027D9264A|nr:KilA-N domain-containing protein [Siphonobacter sp. SORGH_AS_1065]